MDDFHGRSYDLKGSPVEKKNSEISKISFTVTIKNRYQCLAEKRLREKKSPSKITIDLRNALAVRSLRYRHPQHPKQLIKHYTDIDQCEFRDTSYDEDTLVSNSKITEIASIRNGFDRVRHKLTLVALARSNRMQNQDWHFNKKKKYIKKILTNLRRQKKNANYFHRLQNAFLSESFVFPKGVSREKSLRNYVLPFGEQRCQIQRPLSYSALRYVLKRTVSIVSTVDLSLLKGLANIC